MDESSRHHAAFAVTIAALFAILASLGLALAPAAQRPTLSSALAPGPGPSAPSQQVSPVPAAAAPAAPAGPTVFAATKRVAETATVEVALARQTDTLQVPVPVVEGVAPQADEIEISASTAEEATVPVAIASNSDDEAADDQLANTGPNDDGSAEVEITVSALPDPPEVAASHATTTVEVVQIAPTDDPWAAVRECESGNNYAINTGNGFYGAYQFTTSTWNWVVGAIGRDDLVGVRPDRAAPADQDRAANALAFDLPGGGLRHWPICGRQYRN